MKMPHIGRPAFIVLVVFCIFAAGVLVGRSAKNADSLQKVDLSEEGTPYKFINPLLFCQDQNLGNESVNSMETSVGDYISQAKKSGELIDASFYFRDLNGGPWALVNSKFRSLPASLLKVPLAISVYKHAEKNPKFLNTKIIFEGGADTNQSEHFKPPEEIQASTTYRVSDLIGYMLKDSDNAALYLLGSMMDPEELQDSYTRLGIQAPVADKQSYTMTAKTYASFFRILYNGTYLSQENSENLLSLLSQSAFTQGLVDGLPKNIVVAHKFGEASLPDGTLQLHDCGIVYKPEQPYLICVMTKGTNFDTLTKVISHISSMVYETIQNE